MPTLTERTNTVLQWIRSCETSTQLDVCREAADHFITLRPGDTEDRNYEQGCQSEVREAIEEMTGKVVYS